MPRKTKAFSKTRDETEDVVQVLHGLEDDNLPATRQLAAKRLMKLKKINEDTALANIDCGLALGAVILLHRCEEGAEPVLADRLRLQAKRSLTLKPGVDLSSVVLLSIKEIGAKAKILSTSAADIEAHISATYDVKVGNNLTLNADILPNLVSKAIRSLIRKNSISSKSDGEVFATRYFLPGSGDSTEEYDSSHHTCHPSTSRKISNELNNDEDSKPLMNSRPPSRAVDFSASEMSQTSDTTNTKGELKSLQDSLTAFFTPHGSRRGRIGSVNAQMNENKDGSAAFQEQKPIDKELEVVIDDSHLKFKGPTTSSSECSLKSPATSSATTPSPHRRIDRLTDALSPFFSAPSERRRRHEKGDYLCISNGVPLKKKIENESDHAPQFVEDKPKLPILKSEEAENECPLESELPRAASPSRRVRTPKSQASDQYRVALRNSTSLPGVKRPGRQFKKENVVAAMKSASLIKRAKEQCKNGKASINRMQYSTCLIRCPDNMAPTAINRSLASPIRSVKGSPVKAGSCGASLLSGANSTEAQCQIPEEDCAMFDQARETSQKSLYDSTKVMMKSVDTQAFPPGFEFIKYASLSLLHICESCLMYLADRQPHMQKCRAQYPPGNEIYRDKDVSVFEVDGNLARVYCRNLCLLAKLFIDHKTLYFDVEPFLFYVLTVNDSTGCHFVGYFSKEKFSNQKYNLACIVTLPCYQGRGFGRFLIDFSYLLSRREGLSGTPERPLSELGKIAYQSYWRTAIFEAFYKTCSSNSVRGLSLHDISDKTGIAVHDVVETLSLHNMLRVTNASLSLAINPAQIREHWNKAHESKSRIWLDESKLKWNPKVYTPSKEFHMRSPTFSIESSMSPQKMDRISVEECKHSADSEDKSMKSPKKPKKGSSSVKRNLIVDLEASALPPTISNRTPIAPRQSSGKIGRKRPPGKVVKEKKVVRKVVSRERVSSQSSSEEELDENVPEEELKPKPKKTASCKPGSPHKSRHQKTPSSDEQDGPADTRGKRSSRTRANTLASTSSNNNRKSGRRSRGTPKTRQHSKPSVSEEISSTVTKLSNSDIFKSHKKDTKKKEDSDSPSDTSNSSSEYEAPKKPVGKPGKRGRKPKNHLLKECFMRALQNSDEKNGEVSQDPPKQAPKRTGKNVASVQRKVSSSSSSDSDSLKSLSEDEHELEDKPQLATNKKEASLTPKPAEKQAKRPGRPAKTKDIQGCSGKPKTLPQPKLKPNSKIPRHTHGFSSSTDQSSSEEEKEAENELEKSQKDQLAQKNAQSTPEPTKPQRKSRLKRNFSHHHHHTSDEEDEEEESEQEDGSFSTNSRKKDPFFNKNMTNMGGEPSDYEHDTINMGGEPVHEIVNMGGEPGEDSIETLNEDMLNPRAPAPILPPTARVCLMEEEEDEEEEDESEQEEIDDDKEESEPEVLFPYLEPNENPINIDDTQAEAMFEKIGCANYTQPMLQMEPSCSSSSAFQVQPPVIAAAPATYYMDPLVTMMGVQTDMLSQMQKEGDLLESFTTANINDEDEDDDDDDDIPPQLSPNIPSAVDLNSKASTPPPLQLENDACEIGNGEPVSLQSPKSAQRLVNSHELMGPELTAANSSYESSKNYSSAQQGMPELVAASENSDTAIGLVNGSMPNQSINHNQSSSDEFSYTMQQQQQPKNNYSIPSDYTSQMTQKLHKADSSAFSGSSHPSLFSPSSNISDSAVVSSSQSLFSPPLASSSLLVNVFTSPTSSEMVTPTMPAQQHQEADKIVVSSESLKLIDDMHAQQGYGQGQSASYPQSLGAEQATSKSSKKSNKDRSRKEGSKRKSKKAETQSLSKLPSSTTHNSLAEAHQNMQITPAYMQGLNPTAAAMAQFSGMTNGIHPSSSSSYYPNTDYFSANAQMQAAYNSQAQYPTPNAFYNNAAAGWTNPYYASGYPTAYPGLRSPTNPPGAPIPNINPAFAATAAANHLGTGVWPMDGSFNTPLAGVRQPQTAASAAATLSQFYPQTYEYPYGAH
uniref:histone acetyltransferase n=1 Tax=Ditylenchus dipsaci TaxID=166011 RepID=A0A915DDG0_9BILA